MPMESRLAKLRLRRRSQADGMTLIEVLTALAILSVALAGVLAALMQDRRLTEGSVAQNSALTIVQGYMEQMKSMNLTQLVNADTKGVAQLSTSYAIPTVLNNTTADPLYTSVPGTQPTISALTPGITPSRVVDNLKDFADGSGGQGAQTTWALTWPGAQNYPTVDNTLATTVPYPGDLHLNLWVWITDLSGTVTNATAVYGITIVYTWQFKDGARTKYMVGTVRSIRSSVPSF
jgi:prepilin-type N-terminal cleavage/methylation domain-containing protein